jgi:dihydroorotate dehydrogenase electron transfer subunit
VVTDVLPDLLERVEADVVYACGPNGMLRAVAELCLRLGVPCQVAVEEMMACGLGVCWTCVVPYLSSDGRSWWNVRACTEGPVFNGARIWWEHWLGPGLDRTDPPPLTAPEPASPDGVVAAREEEDLDALEFEDDAPATARGGIQR